MDYRIEKRGAFQVVCKRKRVDKPQSGTATREISDMRQEFDANGTPEPADRPPPGAAVINLKSKRHCEPARRLVRRSRGSYWSVPMCL